MKRKDSLMDTKRNVWFLLSLVLVASMLITSCGSPAAPSEPTSAPAAATEAPAQAPAATEEAAPKVLRVRLIRDINNLDSANVTGAVEDTIDRTVMEGLFRFNAEGKLEPQLAESYTISPDGLTIDFTLTKVCNGSA
jgi:ABC-type transport system substrate-binding protein